jgi:hypothetical protein
MKGYNKDKFKDKDGQGLVRIGQKAGKSRGKKDKHTAKPSMDRRQ